MMNAGGYPKAPVVRFDNRSANRKTHSHFLRLGREKSVENPLDVLRIDTGAGILHCYQNAFLFAKFGSHTQKPLAVGRRSHGVYGIDREIEQDLLQLNPVAENLRQLAGEFAVNRHSLFAVRLAPARVPPR